jgi:NADPH:quinone reductase-like Zn-dependent oxidoreductase
VTIERDIVKKKWIKRSRVELSAALKIVFGMGELMKAIVYTKYGSPDVLQLAEVEKPVPKDDEVLVKVRAASINAADLDLLRGTPFLIRFSGPLKPRYKILGSDIAGRVEAAGRNAKQFRPGDEVFADLSACGFGAFAEYVSVPENALAEKPAGMTFEEAAAVPTAAVIALQGLRDRRKIKPGQKILINGAGGGVGTFAVQIAKSFGAEVTGVDSAEKLAMLRSIGADKVIDYRQEDFTLSGRLFDLILDVAAYRSVFDVRRALSSRGDYVLIGGSVGAAFQTIFLGPWISMIWHAKVGILKWKPNRDEDLDFVKMLLADGKVVPVIDRRYRLTEVAAALRYLEQGHVQGKVVLTV